MKKIVKIFSALVFMCVFVSQGAMGEIKFDSDKEMKDAVVDKVEEEPQYPGGVDGIIQHLSSSLQYPTDAQVEGVQGRVVVKFIVEEDGSIEEVTIARGRHQSLDQEEIREVKPFPKNLYREK